MVRYCTHVQYYPSKLSYRLIALSCNRGQLLATYHAFHGMKQYIIIITHPGGLSRSNVSPEVWCPQTIYFEADSPPDTLLTQLLSWDIIEETINGCVPLSKHKQQSHSLVQRFKEGCSGPKPRTLCMSFALKECRDPCVNSRTAKIQENQLGMILWKKESIGGLYNY